MKKTILVLLTMIILNGICLGQSRWEFYEDTNLDESISETIEEGFIFHTKSGNYYRITERTRQRVRVRKPDVTVLKKRDEYKLIIEDFDEPVICELLKVYIDSQIDGEFEGWEGETIFKLMNGEIWQQISYDYYYEYTYSPTVIIFESSQGYELKVEDIEETILVDQIK